MHTPITSMSLQSPPPSSGDKLSLRLALGVQLLNTVERQLLSVPAMALLLQAKNDPAAALSSNCWLCAALAPTA